MIKWGELSFATATKFSGVPVPGGSISGDSSNAQVDDVFDAGDFNDYDNPGAYLAAVDWELYTGGSKVWDWLNAPGCPRLYTFKGYRLLPATDYVLKFRFKSSLESWSEWGEYPFRTAPELTYPTIKFKMKNTMNLSKICKWFDPSLLKVYKNGVYDEGLTNNYSQDQTLSAEGDIIEIKNETADNYPFVHFANNANLISVEAPLPYLRDGNDGEGVTDFGGDVGDNTGIHEAKDLETNSGLNGQNKYGMFALTTSLTSVADYLFKHNPQVLNLGGMGGGGGGAGAATDDKNGGDGAGGYYGGGGGGLGAESGYPKTGNGGSGYGCFYQTSLTTVPDHLLAGLVCVTNMGGYGGGGGGAGDFGPYFNGYAGKGGDGYGCFCESKLASIPAALFSDLTSLTNMGGYGGGGGGYGYTNDNCAEGGSGYGCFYKVPLTTIPTPLFSGLISLTNLGGYGGGDGGANWAGNGGKKGGSGFGCFAETKLTSIPATLFSGLTSLTNAGGYGGGNKSLNSGGGGGGGAGYYGGGGGGGNRGNGAAGGNDYGGGGGTSYQQGGSGGTQDATPQERPENSYGPFANIATLASVSTNLLKDCTNLQFVCGFFKGCSALTPTLRFSSTKITACGGFAESCKAKGTVYVPSSSTTATTFKSQTSANVNVVEE